MLINVDPHCGHTPLKVAQLLDESPLRCFKECVALGLIRHQRMQKFNRTIHPTWIFVFLQRMQQSTASQLIASETNHAKFVTRSPMRECFWTQIKANFVEERSQLFPQIIELNEHTHEKQQNFFRYWPSPVSSVSNRESVQRWFRRRRDGYLLVSSFCREWGWSIARENYRRGQDQNFERGPKNSVPSKVYRCTVPGRRRPTYLEHAKPMDVEHHLLILFVQDHELSEFTDKVLVTESLIQNRHLLRHVVLLRRVSLALVHRISNDLRPLVEPVVALVHETRLFPFLLRGGRLVAIDRDPEIVISIARSRLSGVDGSLQNLVDRFLEKDTRWFL